VKDKPFYYYGKKKKRKKEKEKEKAACCYLSFHTLQEVQLVQCEKLQVLCSVKRNVIYLSFKYFYFFVQCEKLHSS
jgi:hypothetical protein